MINNKLQNLINKSEIISFDIFDTLLLRPFAKPTDLFYFMENKFKLENFAKSRIEKEALLRKNLDNCNEEITYSEIYEQLPEYSSMYNQELEYEYNFLFKNSSMFEVYEYAKSHGKKIIIISDIYLPKDFIEKILSKNGYTDYEKLYVSSELNKTKWKGSLFEYVIKDLNINPKKILHIGDNYDSDYKIPKTYGMKSYHIDKIIDEFYNKTNRFKTFADRYNNNYIVSALLMMLAVFKKEKNPNFWVNFGYSYVGVAVFYFMKWLDLNLIEKYKYINNIFFVARDGYFMKKVFDKITNNKNIKTNYVYAPRLFNIICNFDFEKEHTLETINTLLYFYADELGICRKKYTNYQMAKDLLNKHENKLKQLLSKKKNEYKDYICSLTDNEDNIAFVDSITGAFSSQKLLNNTIDNTIKGFYWFIINEAKKYPQAEDSIAYSKNDFSFDGWDLMEFIFSAPENPIKCIDNGKVIYKSGNKFEQERINKNKKMEEGLTIFIDDILKNPILCDSSLPENILSDWICLLVQQPTCEELKNFASIYHAIDSEHKNYRELVWNWKIKIVKSYMFGWLPIFEYNTLNKIFYLFGFLPFMKKKIKNNGNKIIYCLFNFLPIFKVKKQDIKTKYYILGIKVWKSVGVKDA